MKPIILIPTYNERENIAQLIAAIKAEDPGSHFQILVIDSASPDGTAEVVMGLQKKDPGIHLLTQRAKLGLGRAYLEGMRWALAQGYDLIFTMDADFSHHPRYLARFMKEMQTHDLVVGSRYVPGGELKDWPRPRRILSRFANGYAARITGLPIADLTSGFHCFRSDLLRKVLRYPLRAEGYAFLIALKFWSVVQGATVSEVPIVFSDRTQGTTKISKRVIFESIFFVWKCFFQRHRLARKNHPLLSFKEKEEMKSCSATG